MRALLMLLVLLACSSEPVGPPGLLYGDAQGDGKIDQCDGDLIYALTTGSAVEPIALIRACGDVDADGKITVLDAYHIYAYLQGVPAGRVGKPCRR